MLPRQNFGRHHQGALRPASTAAASASNATTVLPDPTSPCSSRSMRSGRGHVAAGFPQWPASARWSGCRAGRAMILSRKRPSPGKLRARRPLHVGRAPGSAPAGWPAVRHRRAASALANPARWRFGICGLMQRASSAAEKSGQPCCCWQAASCHSGSSGSRSSAARIARPSILAKALRSADRPARSAACGSNSSARQDMVRMGDLRLVADTTRSCRKQTAFHPPASCASSVSAKAWKNTSVSDPVSS